MTRLQAATAALIVASSLMAADSAFAQSGFVHGGFAIDTRRFSGAPDEGVFNANAPTVMIGGGAFLTPLISAGIEFDTQGESDVSQSASVTISGRPQTITTTFTTRRQSVAALFGIHSPAARAVRFAAYAGLAFTTLAQQIATDAPAIVLDAPPPPAQFTHRGAMPLVGADLVITVAPHVAIVGFIRAQALDFGNDLRGFSVRPGAAARVLF